MNVFDLYAKIGLDSSEYSDGLDKAEQKASVFGDVLKANLADKAISKGISMVGTAVNSVVSGLSSLASNYVVQGGLGRALNIENAQFKLQGLGHDAESVQNIMDSALASVKGTAYGLDSAATIAASAIAAGVPVGEELTRTLSLIGDAATIAGRPLEDMGAIFNKVAANGKLTGEELNQLSDSGIPILQLLGETLGKNTVEIREMVSKGQIGFAELQDAIEHGMGGAALKMGETFGGAVSNAKAAASRLGAGFMGNLTKSLTPALGVLTSIIDDIAASNTENVGEKLDNLVSMVTDTIRNLIGDVKPIIESILPIIPSVITAVASMIPEVVPVLLPVLTTVVSSLFNGVMEVIPQLLNMLWEYVFGYPIDGDLGSFLDGMITFMYEMLPNFVNTGMDMIGGLIQGAIEKLPEFLNATWTISASLIESIAKNMPSFMEKGGEIVVNIINGLLDQVPEILANLTNILGSMIVVIMESLPEFIEKGVEVISNMASGIMSHMPYIVASIATMLVTLLATIASHLPEFLQKGFELLGKVGAGIIKAIPSLLAMIPGMLLDIADAFFQYDWLSIGLNIIEGIASGVVNAAGSLVSAAVDAVSSAWDSMLSWLGIASPSKKARDQIGKMWSKGIGIGFELGMPVKDMVGTIEDAFSEIEGVEPPLITSDKDISNSVSVESENGGYYGMPRDDITINVYASEGQDEKQIAKEVQKVLVQWENQRKMVFA